MIIAFTLVSGSISKLFSAGFGEFMTASSIGFLIGILSTLSQYSSFLKYLFPSISACLATIFAFSVNYFWHHPISIHVSLVSGLIVLLPGLTLTIAMAELATENLVSGTARLFSAATIFIQLGFGSAIGGQIGQKLFGNIDTVHLDPASPIIIWIAVLVASMALVPLFSAKIKDTHWFVLAGLVAYGSVNYTSSMLGPSLSAFFGAIIIGLLAKLVSYVFHIPGALILMPGFIILVPGSVGYSSIMAMIQKNIIAGLESGLDVLMIGISLVGGLLLSSLVRLPRSKEGVKDN